MTGDQNQVDQGPTTLDPLSDSLRWALALGADPDHSPIDWIAKELDPLFCGARPEGTSDLAQSGSDEAAICLRVGSASPARTIEGDDFTLLAKLETRAPSCFIKALADMPNLLGCHGESSYTEEVFTELCCDFEQQR